MSGVPSVDPNDRRAEAARWLAFAVDDMGILDACLTKYEPSLGGAAYHCQQAAEKIIKGLMIAAGVAFPYTHDLVALGDVALIYYPEHRNVFLRLGPLTFWSTAFRYPSSNPLANDPPDTDEIEAALADVKLLTTALRALTAPT